ncbi:hypothetical protein FB567DRAFT_612407 [Paraphoma chrysanthemicola]|uniref:Mid2 domain-containing protein n=1 Tax=Paraphoma chrysanthemicola TaxID=798071 RepID=A0A8K0QV09_9PLEO|nr:hypothetical protein FB567DRAFT_612407 [Paraphoma chrysanthemicola]
MLSTILLSAILFVFEIVAHPNFGGEISPIPSPSAVQVRTAPRQSVHDAYDAIRRDLAIASLQKRDDYSTNFSLAHTWQDATIISIGAGKSTAQANSTHNIEIAAGIKVTCKYCYSRGIVTAELIIDDNFNASQTISNLTNEVKEQLEVLRDDVTTWGKGKLVDGLQWSDFDLSTFNTSFDLDVPPIPAANIRFQFDQMELYLDMTTTIHAEATYEIPLFVFQSPVGLKFGATSIGVLLTFDLILSVNGEIDIANGFHIKLDDGVELNIPLFSDQVSDMTFNGGDFEFLPVTIESAGITLSAALRIGIFMGLTVEPPTGLSAVNVGAGIMMEAFANIAEFTAQVKSDAKNTECALQVVNDYKLAVGVYGGAFMSVHIGELFDHTVAAVGSTSTAIFTTTLADICALSRTASSIGTSVSPIVERREDLTTTTLTTKIVNSAVSCTITGLAKCPVSAQILRKGTVTKTLVTAVPSGWSSSFPAETATAVSATRPFGSAVNKIQRTTGKPTEYTPSATGALTDAKDKVGGLSKKAIIGISVGLGVPAILVILGCSLFCWRRKGRSAKSKPQPNPVDEN